MPNNKKINLLNVPEFRVALGNYFTNFVHGRETLQQAIITQLGDFPDDVSNRAEGTIGAELFRSAYQISQKQGGSFFITAHGQDERGNSLYSNSQFLDAVNFQNALSDAGINNPAVIDRLMKLIAQGYSSLEHELLQVFSDWLIKQRKVFTLPLSISDGSVEVREFNETVFLENKFNLAVTTPANRENNWEGLTEVIVKVSCTTEIDKSGNVKITLLNCEEIQKNSASNLFFSLDEISKAGAQTEKGFIKLNGYLGDVVYAPPSKETILKNIKESDLENLMNLRAIFSYLGQDDAEISEVVQELSTKLAEFVQPTQYESDYSEIKAKNYSTLTTAKTILLKINTNHSKKEDLIQLAQAFLNLNNDGICSENFEKDLGKIESFENDKVLAIIYSSLKSQLKKEIIEKLENSKFSNKNFVNDFKDELKNRIEKEGRAAKLLVCGQKAVLMLDAFDEFKKNPIDTSNQDALNLFVKAFRVSLERTGSEKLKIAGASLVTAIAIAAIVAGVLAVTGVFTFGLTPAIAAIAGWAAIGGGSAIAIGSAFAGYRVHSNSLFGTGNRLIKEVESESKNIKPN